MSERRKMHAVHKIPLYAIKTFGCQATLQTLPHASLNTTVMLIHSNSPMLLTLLKTPSCYIADK